MFPFKKTLATANRTLGKNSKEFVILHHTGTSAGSIDGVIRQLTTVLSCHFVVDVDGSAYKIGSPDDILWHAGVSEWNGRSDMNRFSLGIEIVGPTNGTFTDAQRKTVRALTQHLMATFGIPSKNVLRHADLTHALSSRGVQWDGKSPSRKVDVADSFWKIDRTAFSQYQASLIPQAV
ncbi:MAG: N-acetylmuramoyl-L-alanine amidase [Patescibacteria group bacterium]